VSEEFEADREMRRSVVAMLCPTTEELFGIIREHPLWPGSDADAYEAADDLRPVIAEQVAAREEREAGGGEALSELLVSDAFRRALSRKASARARYGIDTVLRRRLGGK
jgi:hypothetical protein